MLKRREDVRHADIWGKDIPGRGRTANEKALRWMERSWAGLQNTKKWAWKTAIGNEVRGVGRREIV